MKWSYSDVAKKSLKMQIISAKRLENKIWKKKATTRDKKRYGGNHKRLVKDCVLNHSVLRLI